MYDSIDAAPELISNSIGLFPQRLPYHHREGPKEQHADYHQADKVNRGDKALRGRFSTFHAMRFHLRGSSKDR
jgi:hypothetical protein